MKRQTLVAALICNAAVLAAQPRPPAAPAAAPVSTVSGRISQFNYGPDGRVDGFLVSPTTLVSLPPDQAIQVEAVAKTGSQARVTGTLMPSASGIQILRPQTLEVAGKTLILPVPSQPGPLAGPPPPPAAANRPVPPPSAAGNPLPPPPPPNR